uniref:DET1 homolog n=1 Tax=Phallusia mammillata TaxID=59560 RepID=A0A6F9DA86_9ASCI|nr:DET1 homolog [Phallusia mammillata]
MEVPDTTCLESNPSEKKFLSRKVPNQNVAYRLRSRETNVQKCGTIWSETRKFYHCIIPNFTVVGVEKPPFYLRKFSPNGRHFIAFSADQTSVEVYEFQGCHAAEKLLANVSGEVLHDFSGGKRNAQFRQFYQTVKEQLFSTFFVLKHQIPVASEGQNLNRECSLFTDDGRHVLVVSATFIPTDPHPLYHDIFTNNEAMTPHPRYPLEDYTIHSVDMINGVLQCSVDFKCDKIFPSHNQGLYLCKNVLAVLSVQHQTLTIFHVNEGNLIRTHTIGRFCFDDDAIAVSSVQQVQQSACQEITFNSLKHRILTHLYKQAAAEGKESRRRFFQHFSFLEDLRIWRMQLLDEDHVLLKYASSDVVGLRIQEPSAQPSFFVVYNFREATVKSVYENTSLHLLKVFEQHPGLFRYADILRGQLQAACSDVHATQLQQRFKETIINAKYGGHTEAVKRLLSQLPIQSQSHSASPYLDLALFSYDDKWISPVERPKACGDYPIRFYSRQSGLLKFQIRAGMINSGGQSSAHRRLVAFTFHPHEPFAISVQRINSEYVFNFHFRHLPCACR